MPQGQTTCFRCQGRLGAALQVSQQANTGCAFPKHERYCSNVKLTQNVEQNWLDLLRVGCEHCGGLGLLSCN